MKKIFKKNQFVITALALMIAVAGYLHFSGGISNQISVSEEGSEEAEEAANLMEYTVEDTLSAEEYANSELTDIVSLDEDADSPDMEVDSSDVQEGEVPGEAVFTSTVSVNTLQSAKLLKEQTRAQNKDTLNEIINNENISQEQKQAAIDSMVSMTQINEKEMASEILLQSKGFEDAVVSITGETADVVIIAEEMTDEARAQIEDIVTRKTGISPENIIISTALH